MFILRALAADGSVSFWTGKAGAAWVSPQMAESFGGLNLEGARRKAKQFNAMSSLHGLRFVVVNRVSLTSFAPASDDAQALEDFEA